MTIENNKVFPSSFIRLFLSYPIFILMLLSACGPRQIILRPIDPSISFNEALDASFPHKSCVETFEFTWPYVAQNNPYGIDYYLWSLFDREYDSPLSDRENFAGESFSGVEKMLLFLSLASRKDYNEYSFTKMALADPSVEMSIRSNFDAAIRRRNRDDDFNSLSICPRIVGEDSNCLLRLQSEEYLPLFNEYVSKMHLAIRSNAMPKCTFGR